MWQIRYFVQMVPPPAFSLSVLLIPGSHHHGERNKSVALQPLPAYSVFPYSFFSAAEAIISPQIRKEKKRKKREWMRRRERGKGGRRTLIHCMDRYIPPTHLSSQKATTLRLANIFGKQKNEIKICLYLGGVFEGKFLYVFFKKTAISVPHLERKTTARFPSSSPFLFTAFWIIFSLPSAVKIES